MYGQVVGARLVAARRGRRALQRLALARELERHARHRIDRALRHVRRVGVGPQPAQVRFSVRQPRDRTRGRQVRSSAAPTPGPGATRRLLIALGLCLRRGALALAALCDKGWGPRRGEDCERHDYQSHTHAHLVLLRQRHSSGRVGQVAKCFEFLPFLYREMTPQGSRRRRRPRPAESPGSTPFPKLFSVVSLTAT